jgi:Flp pilus assembly pilin Flp
MVQTLERFGADELGTTSIEYALMACLIAVAIFGTIGVLGATVLDLYNYIRDGGIEAATMAAAGTP